MYRIFIGLVVTVVSCIILALYIMSIQYIQNRKKEFEEKGGKKFKDYEEFKKDDMKSTVALLFISAVSMGVLTLLVVVFGKRILSFLDKIYRRILK